MQTLKNCWLQITFEGYPLTSIISCDATNYERWKPETRFNALIGVSVQTDKPADFKKKYVESMKAFLKKYKLKQEKKAYCSSDLYGMFFDTLGLGHTEFKNALEELVTELCSDSYVTVFHASCNTKKLPEVTVFLEDAVMGKTQQVPTMEFLRDWLAQYYVYISAWKLLKCLQAQGKQILLDGFRGPISNAWNELSRNNKVEIVNLGDECNAFVSIADLVARFINEALGPFKITQENIEKINLKSKEYHVHYCFQGDLINIVPLYEGAHCRTGRQIHFANYWRKPTIYVLKEGSDTIMEDTEWLRQTSFYNAACDLAFDVNGCVKFYDKSEDRTFASGDKFIYYGPKGKSKAAEIELISEGLGIKVETIPSKSLLT